VADKSTELDAFLGAPEPEPAPAAEPKQDAAPEAKSEPDAEPDAEADDADADTDPAGMVRASVMLQERKRRQDWKDKAARAETERDELRKQLDEAKRFAQQPPPQQYQPPPQPQYIDPTQDPQGYRAQLQQERQHDLLNERLNLSQAAAMREHGAEAVTKATEEFRAAMQQNPSLQSQLYQQLDPYQWVMQQAEVLRLHREIGEDPAAYKARLRAEWEAERGASQEAPLSAGPASTMPRMAPSLASARSAAPRSAAAWSGPPTMDDILAGRPGRK
jgi:hypothetical protein